MVYNEFSKFLQNKYGEKVYKLPIKLDGTCPNRDGTIGWGACAYCGEEGGSFENLNPSLTVKEQLEGNKEYISRRYKANKFIAYFQNFTNTYMKLDDFIVTIKSALLDDIVAIYISTRPDTITEDQLDFLFDIKESYGVDIVFELGLQSVNYHILNNINRGHSLAEYIDAVLRIQRKGFDVCTHLIIGLPGETKLDVIEGAKIISSLKTQQVKLHALYIVENTEFSRLYRKGELKLISLEEYKERVILFLRYLDPDIVVQRIISRSDEDKSLFSNWDTSWWKIRDDIIIYMEEKGFRQGDLFDYLDAIIK